jgi:hypothetical protein
LVLRAAEAWGNMVLTLESIKGVLGVEVDPAQLEKVVVTIVALWLLQNTFEDKEDEWQMIARKAKGYLK